MPSQLKKVPCSYKDCGMRRVHHERPDTPRGVQMVTVGEKHEGPAYCSLTCALLDGAISIVKRASP